MHVHDHERKRERERESESWNLCPKMCILLELRWTNSLPISNSGNESSGRGRDTGSGRGYLKFSARTTSLAPPPLKTCLRPCICLPHCTKRLDIMWRWSPLLTGNWLQSSSHYACHYMLQPLSRHVLWCSRYYITVLASMRGSCPSLNFTHLLSLREIAVFPIGLQFVGFR